MKTTPGTKTCSPIFIVLMPVISSGVVSGVNWMRLNLAPSTCAIARPSSVFALPGGPSISTCPCASAATSSRSTASSLADDDLADLLARAVAQVDQVLVWTCCDVRHVSLLGSFSQLRRYSRFRRVCLPLAGRLRASNSACASANETCAAIIASSDPVAVGLLGHPAGEREGGAVRPRADADPGDAERLRARSSVRRAGHGEDADRPVDALRRAPRSRPDRRRRGRRCSRRPLRGRPGRARRRARAGWPDRRPGRGRRRCAR